MTNVNGKITSWRRYIDFAQHKEGYPTARQLGIAVGIWVVGGENSSTTLPRRSIHRLCGGYHGGWRRELHPTAFSISFIRGVLQPPLTNEIRLLGADAIRPRPGYMIGNSIRYVQWVSVWLAEKIYRLRSPRRSIQRHSIFFCQRRFATAPDKKIQSLGADAIRPRPGIFGKSKHSLTFPTHDNDRLYHPQFYGQCRAVY